MISSDNGPFPRGGFHVLINAESGTARQWEADRITALAAEQGVEMASCACLPGDQFTQRLHELADDRRPVLVGGGDGTIARCAALHLEKEKPFGILPFGTMNLLARDLGIPLSFPESLAAYRNPQPLHIDAGMVNGQLFLCCAAWGTMPEGAQFREDNRDTPGIVLLPRLTAHILEQMERTGKRSVRLTLDGRTRRLRTAMLVVSNNLYDPSATESFNRDTLQDGLLGVYSVAARNLPDRLRILLRLFTGGWRDDPALHADQARTVRLETKRRTELLSIDGEPMEMEGPFTFTLRRRALPLIVPAPSPGARDDLPKDAQAPRTRSDIQAHTAREPIPSANGRVETPR